MAILVIAEHDNRSLKGATFNTITAAAQIGADIHVLVAGRGCTPVAEAVSGIEGVVSVLIADAPHLEALLAEDLAKLVVGVVANEAGSYTHVLAPATAFGKNFLLPRRRFWYSLGRVLIPSPSFPAEVLFLGPQASPKRCVSCVSSYMAHV